MERAAGAVDRCGRIAQRRQESAMDPVLSTIRQIQNDAIKAAKPLRQAYEEALEVARARQADWQARIREGLKSGNEPPPRPPEAIEPDPVPLPRVVVGDTTPEKLGSILRDNEKGLLLNRDEIAGWLGSFGRYSSDGGGERAMWLEAYGGRAYTIDRQKNPEPILIAHLSVAVLGGVQPDKLSLITGGADDGFAARFLWCWPEPVSGFRLAREPVNGQRQEEALQRLHALSMPQDHEGSRQPGYVPLSEAAAAHFERYVAETKARANAASGMLSGSLGKVPGHVLRLALVLEYLGWCEAPFRSEPSGSARQRCWPPSDWWTATSCRCRRGCLGRPPFRMRTAVQWSWRGGSRRRNPAGSTPARSGARWVACCGTQAHGPGVRGPRPSRVDPTRATPGDTRRRSTPSLYDVNPALLEQSVAA